MDQSEVDRDLTAKPSATPGKPPTMEDVASRAGVSRALVSIVFRGLLSLIGDDDSRLAHASWTRLTTVAQDTPALAEGAVTRAVARIRPSELAAADGPEEPHLTAPALVIRSTTARPAGTRNVPDTRRL